MTHLNPKIRFFRPWTMVVDYIAMALDHVNKEGSCKIYRAHLMGSTTVCH